ncbi:hypothetical protein GGTG_11221 [Gaeumannomyces tritici R3-111a-1]|uniref:Uncharacterized protein n=1 Tax=Gaeumannomyces tritici (strain R3-111a-1) TaxID=644352 RepID=J3PCK0_GAET3|nr:hypothetical protein GGTG_11221 [Gaeumannomyces tritici R3-111a-1]EJT71970.1 hypothetical protein GGTG_11221 [Gaeumannomyces tritici R3-111a-1]
MAMQPGFDDSCRLFGRPNCHQARRLLTAAILFFLHARFPHASLLAQLGTHAVPTGQAVPVWLGAKVQGP